MVGGWRPQAVRAVFLAGAFLFLGEFRRLRRRALRSARCTLVVKLGGSAVTDKTCFETVRVAALRETACALSRSPLLAGTVLVHGAGSFGHFHAREHGVSRGTAHSAFSWRGFALTRSSVTRLNGIVLTALLEQGIAACGLPPFPRWVLCGGALTDTDAPLGEVRSLLSRGVVPVLHGDAVFDEARGAAILSGDTLVEELCAALRPTRAVFLTDVAGIFDRPPGEDGAALLRRIVVGPSGEVVDLPQMRTAAHDVTGGVAAKLSAAARVAAGGVPVVIVEVGTVHAEAALRGEWPERCTVVTGRGETRHTRACA